MKHSHLRNCFFFLPIIYILIVHWIKTCDHQDPNRNNCFRGENCKSFFLDFLFAT